MLDEDRFKAQQRALWDASAAAWDGWSGEIETWFAPITARLLEDAGAGPGQRILDLGTRYGEPALTAAARIGADGEVVGIDLSPLGLMLVLDQVAALGAIRSALIGGGVLALATWGRPTGISSRRGSPR